MGDELRKRNTDCVYFLASPLTCKKGVDCEYRHSEIARLNPRDCFYWLAGNCLNAACGFRHPPMDSPAGTVSDTPQCSLPVNKTNIPCYFYFNAFCSKGDTCSFLHGNYIKTVAAKSTTGFPGNGTFSSEDKIAAANTMGSASTDTFIHSSVNVSGATKEAAFQGKENLQHSSVKNVGLQSACAQNSISISEEVPVDEPISLLPAEASNDSVSDEVADQSFEEPITNHFEQENRRESSPGFDVLVDYKSEDLEYDDPQYLLATNMKHRELDSELCENDFEDLVQYESMYSDVELLDAHEMHRYNHFESEPIFFKDRKVFRCSGQKMLGSMFAQKRKLHLMNLDAEKRNHVDLRNYLQRHRDSGKRSNDGMYRPSFRKRLKSEVGKMMDIDRLGDTCRYRSFRHPRQYKSHDHYNRYEPARRRFHVSSISRRPVSRDCRYNPRSSSFEGPKTLSQIKEEKRRLEEHGGFILASAVSSADFKGPKPLSDILKEKKKLEFTEIHN